MVSTSKESVHVVDDESTGTRYEFSNETSKEVVRHREEFITVHNCNFERRSVACIQRCTRLSFTGLTELRQSLKKFIFKKSSVIYRVNR